MIERVVNGRIRAINMGCGHGDGSMEINSHVNCPYTNLPIHPSHHMPIVPYIINYLIRPLPHIPIAPYVHCPIFLLFCMSIFSTSIAPHIDFPLYGHRPKCPLSHSSIAPYAHCAISFLLHTSQLFTLTLITSLYQQCTNF